MTLDTPLTSRGCAEAAAMPDELFTAGCVRFRVAALSRSRVRTIFTRRRRRRAPATLGGVARRVDLRRDRAVQSSVIQCCRGCGVEDQLGWVDDDVHSG